MTYDDLKNELELRIDELVGEGSSLAARYAVQELSDPVVQDHLTMDLAMLRLRFQSQSAAVAVLTCQMGLELSCDPLAVLCGYLDLPKDGIFERAAVLADQLGRDIPAAPEYSVYDSDAVQRHFFGNSV